MTILIGISGPSGSGKSVLANCLADSLSGALVLEQDWYFIHPDLYPDNANFCDPKYLQLEQFIGDVRALSEGKVVEVYPVDKRTFLRLEHKLSLVPQDFVIVEGMTIFRIPAIYTLFHRRLYLSPGISALRKRKIRRDSSERERSHHEIIEQLMWIEMEYQRDLVELSPDVFVIDGEQTEEVVCHLGLQFVNSF